ncbi:hypothetical protein NQ318_003810 [Aromia moschata]|uniref:Secreted protein n=1 Tax=Aromia moschata TaxID=1265417 RepID=A0AAV8XVL8_9CUCU|nr:hypothetical protein NQ318_003810 [Aromia moschata]
MVSISKLIVIMCLYNGLAAVNYLQCTENMPKSPEAKKRTVRNRLLTTLSILNFVQWGSHTAREKSQGTCVIITDSDYANKILILG